MNNGTTKQKRTQEELLAASRARTEELAAKVAKRRVLESDGPTRELARKLNRGILACNALLNDRLFSQTIGGGANGEIEVARNVMAELLDRHAKAFGSA